MGRLPRLHLTPEPDVDLCRPTVWKAVKRRIEHLHNNRVQRTTIRRAIHNIWTSCHVAVTYIITKRPQSLQQGIETFAGAPRTNMRRGILVLLSLSVLLVVGYFTASKW